MIIAERYELNEPIGAGGEARVFRARDRETNGEVALRLGGIFEATAQSEMPASHPGWVRLLDQGVDAQQGAFTIYELVRGESLGAIVRRAPLAPDTWLNFASQSLAAVAALHESRWVHGDLNAENFLLQESTAWRLLELPFHQAAPPESRAPLFGSIFTLAPEQIEGRRPDSRSDLYSLGCLYYYAASGKYPHAGGSEADIAIGRLRFAPTPLEEFLPDWPHHLADWTLCLLARHPEDRPIDASSALRSLDV